VNNLKKTKHLLGFLKPDKNKAKKCGKLKHMVFNKLSKVGEENQVLRKLSLLFGLMRDCE